MALPNPILSPAVDPQSRQLIVEISESNGCTTVQTERPIEAAEIRNVLESFISTEKQGLERFFKIPLSEELVQKVTFMAEKLMSDGCNRVFAKRFTILSLYDLSILIG